MPAIELGDQVEVEGQLGIWTVDDTDNDDKSVNLWHEHFGRLYGIPIQQLKRVPSTRDLILKIENRIDTIETKIDLILQKLGPTYPSGSADLIEMPRAGDNSVIARLDELSALLLRMEEYKT